MRFIYGAAALCLWTYLVITVAEQGFTISKDMFVLTSAIVTAGAMAGGK